MRRFYRSTALVICLSGGASSSVVTQDRTAGAIRIYARVDQIEVRDEGQGPRYTLPAQIAESTGLKLAFLARATGGITSVPLNMFDTKAQDNTTPKSYAWVDESWRPILYRCDRFRYNSGAPDSTVGPDTAYENVLFHGAPTPGGAGILTLRDFVIYRGEDVEAPEPPAALSITVTADGAHLAWRAPRDNVGVALYVVSRAGSDGKFTKVADTSEPAYVDKPPAAGDYRYRVLAGDFQDNLSQWSDSVSATITESAQPARPTDYETDRLSYAPYVRQIHESGKGKVAQGRALQFGDSLSGALKYQLDAEAALGRYAVEARGREGWKSNQGRTVIAQDLTEINPELCLILYGTNNSKDKSAIAAAMSDLLAIAQACASHGSIPVVGTIPPRGFSDRRSQPEADYNASLIKMCRTNHIPVAYIFETLQQQPDRRKYLAADGIHWDGDGFEITARVWRTAVEQVNFAVRDRD